MSQEVQALILSVAAGLATLLGMLFILISPKKNEKLLSISLGFAAGVMISVSFTDLFPNSVNFLEGSFSHPLSILIAVASLGAGIGLAALLDHFVPHQAYDEASGDRPHQNLFRVGVVSTLAIALHNFPEGIATFMAGYDNLTLGLSVAVAIALHNIPEGISVAMPIYFATGSKKRAFGYTFLSGIAEPLGAFLAFLVLRPLMSDLLMGILFSLVAGIMLYISIEELLPSSRQYGHDRSALIATFIGICFMPLTQMF